MQIGVGGIFQFSEIFGGKLDFTTDCTLEISGGYYLIYAKIRDFDVLHALDQAFDLGLGDASLNVASAGFFTFSKTSDSAPQKLLSEVFPQSPVPATVAQIATPVNRTTSFWLSVDLAGKNGDKGLFGSLVDIGVSSASQLSLSATFVSQMQASTAIKSAEYSIALSGTIDLFGVFTFSDVAVSFTMAQATRVRVSGKIAVSVFDSHFTFSGWVRSDSAVQAVTANIAAEGTANLSSLFGGAFPNISFTGLAFNLYYPYGNNESAAQFMLRGNCDFAGLKFTGLLYMQGTKPLLASVVFTQSASIGKLFDQCIQGASWPSNLVDLIIDSGAQAYYNATSNRLTLTLSNDGSGPTLLPVPGGSKTQQPGQAAIVPSKPETVIFERGFNLAASFELTLLDAIEIDGTIVVNSNGVTASIDIGKPIDIYVLQITRQNAPTLGPVLSISTQGNSGTMGFQGAILFFEENFGINVTVAAGKDRAGNLLVTTKLRPTKDYPPLLSASDTLGFSYSKAEGFKVTDWPAFTEAEDLIDFFAELKKLSDAAGSGCGAIVNFIMTEMLTQSYSCKPSFSSGPAGLSLSLAISYTLSFDGAQFATITLPNALVIPIPKGVTLNESSDNYLWKVIARAIGAAAQSFLQALIDNPGAIGTFLVLFAGKSAASYAATLICQGIGDAAVGAAVEAGMDAAGAALGTVGIGAVLGAVVDAATHAGGSGGGGGGGRSNPPAAPAGLAVLAGGDDAMCASWQLSSGAQNYAATLSGPDGTIAVSGALSYDITSFTFAQIRRPATLPATGAISVVASNPVGSSPPATTAITFLAPPTNLLSNAATAMAPTVAVEISWSAAAGATGYSLTVSGGKSESLTIASVDAVLTFTPADPPGPYVISIVSTGRASALPSPNAQITLTRLQAPTGLGASASAAMISLNWTGVAGAASYAILWTSPEGTTGVQNVVASEGDAQSGSVTPPPPLAAGDWTLTVQAMPPEGPGLLIAGPPSSPLTVHLVPAETPEQYAKSNFAAGLSGATCGALLLQAFPTLTATALAVAMAQGGYTADSTGTGLHAAFPDITPAEMAAALAAAYPGPSETPEQLATACFGAGVDGAACGRQLISAFPALTATTLAIAMAKGGYAAPATGSGLHAAFATLSPAEMAQALAAAYPPAPQTPAELARYCFSAGMEGGICGQRLIADFPALTPNPLAAAMASASYAAAATASGLHAAFPSITAGQMAVALTQAYS